MFAFFMAQNPSSLAVVDLYSSFLSPSSADFADVTAKDIVLKCVVTTLYSFEEHRKSFLPDRTVLLLRNPADNFVSLSQKGYKNGSGNIEDKFAKLEEVFQSKDRFDAVVKYEDLVRMPEKVIEYLRSKSISADPSYLKFSRTPLDLRRYAMTQSKWCAANIGKWGMGSLHWKNQKQMEPRMVDKDCPDDTVNLVKGICPKLYEFYVKGAPPCL